MMMHLVGGAAGSQNPLQAYKWARVNQHTVKDGWDKLNFIWKFDQPTYYYPSKSEIEIIVKIQLSSCLEYSLFFHTLISRFIYLFIYPGLIFVI